MDSSAALHRPALMKFLCFKSFCVVIALALVTGCGSSSSSSSGSSTTLMGIAVDNATTPTKLYLSNFDTNGVGSVAITGGATTSMTNASPAFSGPQGLVLVGANLMVVDALNHAIRQVSTTSPYTTTTYAGTVGAAGNNDTDGTFYLPRNAVADAAGNLYVTDSGNNTVRMIATGSKAVTTIASGFNNPWGITIDSAQNLYVTDIGTNSIKKITQSGGTWSVSVFAGNVGGNYGLPTNANGTAAYFNYPLGITSDNNFLYVVDSGNNAIRRIALTAPYAVELMAGSSAGTAGNSVNATGGSALLSSPAAIAYGNGAVYVTDQTGTVLRKVSTSSPYGVTAITLN